MSKAKAHIVYKEETGRRVPGVTTITGQLAKGALVPWANKLGLQGIDVSKYVDDKAAIGTLAHKMILDYFRKEKTDTSDYSKNQIDQAENSLLSFFSWEKQHELKPLIIEEPLVNEVYHFGGTPDFFGLVDGGYEILDFKTGSGIYGEYWYQLAGYYCLLKHKREEEILRGRILNIPRTEDESFKEESKDKASIFKYVEGFLRLVEFYHLDKEAKAA